ncbi:MAG: hypothetical protein ACLU38_10580 [Dysosmobacter sp.]
MTSIWRSTPTPSENGLAQLARGIIAFTIPAAPAGSEGAELIAQNLRKIYPFCPTGSTTALPPHWERCPGSGSPAVLVEIGYHDNYSRRSPWIEGHVEAIAQQLVRALTEYFGLPFIQPHGPDARAPSV